jgi:hypothetical protein
MMDLDEPAWQALIDHAYEEDLLNQGAIHAFRTFQKSFDADMQGKSRAVVIMFDCVGKKREDLRVCMELAQKKDNTYTVGDHTATATVPPHLQRDYHPTFVVLDGKPFYKDGCQCGDPITVGMWFYKHRCQCGNGERKLTAFKQEHRVYMCVHGPEKNDSLNSGWYVDSAAWQAAADQEQCSGKRQAAADQEQRSGKRQRSE